MTHDVQSSAPGDGPGAPGYPALPKARRRAWRALQRKKERRETGLLPIEGRRLFAEAATAGADVRVVVTTAGALADEGTRRAVAQMAARPGVEVFAARDSELAELADTESHQGVWAACAISPRPLGELFAEGAPVVFLAGAADPGNAGAILRSACAFGFRGAAAGEGTVELTSPKVARASAGAIFRMRLAVEVAAAAAVQLAREADYAIFLAATRGGADPGEVVFPRRTMLVLSSETGRSDPAFSQATRVTIPMVGPVESLNLAAAAAVLMARIAACGVAL
ncbi:MAG: RNA methyltransferase [Planctomycetes bacterium]|nr:RNA methyltransferase [Planctomycetota bacterium]